MIIGLTGSISSGKTTTTNYLKELGYNVIDCDKISHQVLNDNAEIITNLFGVDIVENNIINRKKLGSIVFNDTTKLNELNNIIHPLVKKEVIAQLSDFCFVDCPLLFETDFIDLVDKSLLIYVDKNIQITRLMKRDNISKEECIKKINLQMPLEEKKELANFIIYNNKSKKMLYNKINDFLKEIYI